MFCKNCGKEMEPEAKFCIICGATASSEDAKSFCANCGKELKPEAVFCPSCGVNVTSVQAQTYTVPVVNYVPVVTYQPVVQAPVAVPNPPTQSQSSVDFDGARRIDYENAGIFKMSTSMIIGGISLFVGMVFFILGIVFENLFMLIPSVIILAEGIFSLVTALVAYLNSKKRYCLVTADSISGIIADKTEYKNKRFKLTYSDIESAEKNEFLQIVTIRMKNSEKLTLPLPRDEIDFVYDHIQRKITQQNT